MKILIIGGTRFLGWHIAVELLNQGHDVTVFHRPATANAGYLPEELSFAVPSSLNGHRILPPVPDAIRHIHGDRLCPDDLARASRHNFDAVVDTILFRRQDAENAIRIFRDTSIKHYVFLSSIAEYGAAARSRGTLTETDVGTPHLSDPYGQGKTAARKALMDAYRDLGFPATAFVINLAYGPYDPIVRELKFFSEILAGATVYLPCRADAKHNQDGFAGNICAAIASGVGNHRTVGEVYNVAGTGYFSTRDAVSVFAEVLGREPRIITLPAEAESDLRRKHAIALDDLYFDDRPVTLDIGKFLCHTSFEFPYAVEDGLRRTAAWIRDHLDHLNLGRHRRLSPDSIAIVERFLRSAGSVDTRATLAHRGPSALRFPEERTRDREDHGPPRRLFLTERYDPPAQLPRNPNLVKLIEDRTPSSGLHLGTRCNQACRYCEIVKDPGDTRSLKDAMTAVDRIVELGIAHVSLKGGEPTTHPDILKLVRYCRDRSIRDVELLTNGVRLADLGFARALLDSGVTQVQLSFDDTRPEVNATLTSNPQYPELQDRFIQNILSLDWEVLLFKIMAAPNLDGTEAYVRYVRDLEEQYGKRIPVALAMLKPRGVAWVNRETLFAHPRELAANASDALRLANTLGLTVTTQSIPSCMLADHLDAPVELYHRIVTYNCEDGSRSHEFYDENYEYRDKCEGCMLKGICPGVLSRYEEVFGPETFADPVPEVLWRRSHRRLDPAG